MSKVPVCIRPDYVMYIEYFQNYLWFHTDIHKWTAEVKRNYKEDLEKLESLLGAQLHALITEDNWKLKKFAETFNWKQTGTLTLKDGSNAFIYASMRNTGE